MRVFYWAFKLCVASLVGYFVVKSAFSSTLGLHFKPELVYALLIVQPIIVCSFFLLAMRHVLLVGAPRLRLRFALRAMVLAQGLNLVLPARASELLKVTYLRDHAGIPVSVGVSAVALERIADLLIVSLLGLLAIVNYFDQGDFLPIFLVGITVVVFLILIIRFPSFVSRGLSFFPSGRIRDFFTQAYFHFSSAIRKPVFIYAFFLGLIIWALSYLNILLFLNLAGGVSVAFSGALFVFVMTTLGAAIPALPGGFGTYEAAAIVALRTLGYSFDQALVLALVMHVSQLALPFLLAMVIMLTDRLGISSLLTDLRADFWGQAKLLNKKNEREKHD